MENIKLYAICSANIINKLKSNELVWRWRKMAKQRWRRCLQSRKSISIGVANGNVRLNRYFNLILVHIECNSIGSRLVYVFFFSFFGNTHTMYLFAHCMWRFHECRIKFIDVSPVLNHFKV